MIKRIGAAVVVWVALSVPYCWADSDEVEPLPVKYVGNSYSQKFHQPMCAFAQVMWRRRRLDFHSRHEAIERGFKPCCWCLPKRWKHLEGRILTVDTSGGEGLKVLPDGSSTN